MWAGTNGMDVGGRKNTPSALMFSLKGFPDKKKAEYSAQYNSSYGKELAWKRRWLRMKANTAQEKCEMLSYKLCISPALSLYS